MEISPTSVNRRFLVRRVETREAKMSARCLRWDSGVFLGAGGTTRDSRRRLVGGVPGALGADGWAASAVGAGGLGGQAE